MAKIIKNSTKRQQTDLNAFYGRALSVNILINILHFSINLHLIPVSFFLQIESWYFFFLQNALF